MRLADRPISAPPTLSNGDFHRAISTLGVSYMTMKRIYSVNVIPKRKLDDSHCRNICLKKKCKMGIVSFIVRGYEISAISI